MFQLLRILLPNNIKAVTMNAICLSLSRRLRVGVVINYHLNKNVLKSIACNDCYD